MRPHDPHPGHDPRAPRPWPPQHPPAAPPPHQVPADQADTVEAAQFHRPPPPSVPGPAHPPHAPQHPVWTQPPHTPQPPAGGPPPQVPAATPTAAARGRRPLILGAVAALAVAAAAGGGYLYTQRDTSAASTAPPAAPGGSQVPAGPVTTVPAEPTTSDTPAPPPPPPPAPVLTADALPGLLLPADQISTLLGTPGMTATRIESQPLDAQIAPAQCDGPWGPAYATTYTGSGFTGLAVQVVTNKPVQAAQAVAAFPDAAAAKVFFDRQAGMWNACKNTRITQTVDGDSSTVESGVPAMVGEVMTLALTALSASTPGQHCERDMTYRGNVVIDVRACSPTLTDTGRTIATTIADKVR